jgi:uncharacterized membrane protein (UPF0127 family)
MNVPSFSLINARTERAVADCVEVALTRNARRRGLLGRSGLAPSSALVLAPCAAVHTMFMRFAIDVIFVDQAGRAVHVVNGLAPWRAAMARVAHAVVELPAGTLADREVAVGDSLYLMPSDGSRVALSAPVLRERLS